MKRITIRKGGFTLTEIILVVSIILILSSAAFVGVAVTLNRATTMQKNLSDTNGYAFESAAWMTVKNMHYGDEGNITAATYTPEDTEESNPSASSTESFDLTEAQVYDQVANDDIQDLLNSGVTRDHIWVVRDESGRITDWSWYSTTDPDLSWKENLTDEQRANIASHRITQIPKGSVTTYDGNGGSNQQGQNQQGQNQQGQQNQPTSDPYSHYEDVTSPTQKTYGGVTTTVYGSNANGGGSKPVVNTICGDDDNQYITMTSLDGWNPGVLKIRITQEDGVYKLYCDGGAYVLVQGGMDGANYSGAPITLEDSQKKWLKDNYGIVIE